MEYRGEKIYGETRIPNGIYKKFQNYWGIQKTTFIR